VVFESLKVVPKQRITSLWANTLVDAIELAYNLGRRGDPDAPFTYFYSVDGFFFDNVFVQGKPVIKDGDPISIYDIFSYAQSKLTASIDASILTSYMRDARDRIIRLRLDTYGNVGIIIADPLDAYGRVRVSSPSELVDEFRPVSAQGSITATSNTAGLSIALDKGGRPNVNIYYSLGGAGNVYVEVSMDGSTWRLLDTISLSASGSGVRIYSGVAYRYVRARSDATGINIVLEIVASR
jgi:hypothetical protein